MTIETLRNDIERLRIVWMVVFLCLFIAGAFQCAGFGNAAISDGVGNCRSSFQPIGMGNRIFCSTFSIAKFTLVAFAVSVYGPLVSCPTTRRSKIKMCAILTPICQSTYGRTVFAKLRESLNLLAFGTFLCYDGFRHGFFSIKKSCLEPVAAHTAVGLLYCTSLREYFKEKYDD